MFTLNESSLIAHFVFPTSLIARQQIYLLILVISWMYHGLARISITWMLSLYSILLFGMASCTSSRSTMFAARKIKEFNWIPLQTTQLMGILSLLVCSPSVIIAFDEFQTCFNPNGSLKGGLRSVGFEVIQRQGLEPIIWPVDQNPSRNQDTIAWSSLSLSPVPVRQLLEKSSWAPYFPF